MTPPSNTPSSPADAMDRPPHSFKALLVRLGIAGVLITILVVCTIRFSTHEPKQGKPAATSKQAAPGKR